MSLDLLAKHILLSALVVFNDVSAIAIAGDFLRGGG